MSIEIEYRVVPVTRFIVTRWHKDLGVTGTSERGEYLSENVAYEIANALAESERQALGYALDDPRMKYPEIPQPAA